MSAIILLVIAAVVTVPLAAIGWSLRGRRAIMT